MELKKLCGIISYFPDDQALRENRKMRCFDLLGKLNEHFRLPILLVAQNWTDEDLGKLNEFTNQQIYVSIHDKLGIVGARMKLREIFLNQTNADYIILLDDDSELEIGPGAVEHYLKEIDDHPDMMGRWRLGFPRLMAVSRKAYQKLGYDFIKDFDPERGEIWEDHCWHVVFTSLWPKEVYDFSKYNMKETSPYSENDPNSVYYHKWVNDSKNAKNIRNKQMGLNSAKVIRAWINSIRGGKNMKCSFIIPAYNSSQWIVKCLDSIPTRDDIEVIVVDDCSTDNTLEILNSYQNRWAKYTVLHQEVNRGPGEARQRGLDIAEGDRVYFGDSDDWFYPDNLSAVIDRIFQPDLINIDEIAGLHTNNRGQTQTHIFEYSINNAFIKRELLKGFKYPSGYFSEDEKAYHKLVEHNKRQLSKVIAQVPIWHYNIPREGSLTDIRHKVSKQTTWDVNDYKINFEDLVKKVTGK